MDSSTKQLKLYKAIGFGVKVFASSFSIGRDKIRFLLAMKGQEYRGMELVNNDDTNNKETEE